MNVNRTYKDCPVLKVVDGDTVDLDVDLGFSLHLIPQRVRLYGINCPEKNTPEGKAAKAFVEALLPVGSKVTLISLGWDKYAKPQPRVDGRIVLERGAELVDVSHQLLENGHAKVWDGKGPKP